MLNVESTREIDRLREGAIEGVEEGRKEGGKEGNGHRIAAANRTSTELHLCFIPMQSQQLYELPVIISHAWYSHGLQQSHIRKYVVSGPDRKRIRSWRNAESMHTTLVMTRRDC